MEQKQQACNSLQHWYQQTLGRLFREAETATLDRVLAPLFGRHVVTLGMPTGRDLLAISPMLHRHRLNTALSPAGTPVDLLAQPTYLPFDKDCIDAVILPHVLEFATEPQAILQEVDRVLIPEGRVIILGFNPLSSWGLWRFMRRGTGNGPWSGYFISLGHLRNSLADLGFEPVAVHYYFYRPPLESTPWLHRFSFCEGLGAQCWPFAGASYVLVAKKHISTLTLIKPRWRSHRHILSEGIANRNWRKPLS